MRYSLDEALALIDKQHDIVGLVTAASLLGQCTSWGVPVELITTNTSPVAGAVVHVQVPDRTRRLVSINGYRVTSPEDTIADLIMTDASPQFLCEALEDWYTTEQGGEIESWGTLDKFMADLGITEDYEYWKELALLE